MGEKLRRAGIATVLTWTVAWVCPAAFGAPLAAEYGSCEAGVMAFQCPHGTLHTCDDIVAVELVRRHGMWCVVSFDGVAAASTR